MCWPQAKSLRIPRESLAAPGYLEVFQARFPGAWSEQGSWEVSHGMGFPFPPKPFRDSWKFLWSRRNCKQPPVVFQAPGNSQTLVVWDPSEELWDSRKSQRDGGMAKSPWDIHGIPGMSWNLGISQSDSDTNFRTKFGISDDSLIIQSHPLLWK